MKITIESTTEIVQINRVPARIWEGKTESGIPVHCLVTRIAVHKDEDAEQFEKELIEQKPPSIDALKAYDLRMVL